jgi:hypothetical protein
MPKHVDTGDYFLEQEIEEAKAKGYDEASFRAGYTIGYSTGCTLLAGREMPVIAQPGETVVTTGSRAVPLQAVVSAIQASGVREWRPGRVVLYAALLVASVLALMAGLAGIFGPEVVAAGLSRVWDWWIQPG